jgi:assimilatory nitrate reductase catalytic subunit
MVKTHCCFCGQQCGIQLKVRENQVIGFEPWEEFPFNHGMLCPKGVKRYLQGGHPDRLLDPLLREPNGFRAAAWGDTLDFTARRLQEIQQKYGKDSVAIYGGASLISEKSYLLGKFARVALGTRHIDYNGRLCMVSAGTAYKLAFGVDRSPLPWSDIPKAQVILVAGANVAECAPITTDYIWRCRDGGGKLMVVDPRMTPICRNADVYLPVRPGTDLALYMGLLHVVLRDGLEKRESSTSTRPVFLPWPSRCGSGTHGRWLRKRASLRNPSNAPHTCLQRWNARSPCTPVASNINPKVWRTAWH